MHTLPSWVSVFCSFFKSRLGGGREIVSVGGGGLFLIGLLLLLVPPVQAQVDFPGTPDHRRVNVRVYPTDVWGPRVGPGIGAGMVVHNLARSNDQWLVTAAPARYEQTGTVSFASANPHRARRYVLVDARALHTDREWIGASTFRRSALRGRLRVGQHLLGRRLLVQPHLELLSSTVSTVETREGRSASVPSPLLETDHTGLRTGIDLRLDTRERRIRTRRGVLLQGTWDRYVPVDGSALQFDQVDLDAHGFVPLGGLHRLVVQVRTTLTQAQSDTPIPPYMLPTVGGSVVPGWPRGHFVGADRVLGSLLYRIPLFQIGDQAIVEGHVGPHLAAVYETLGDQFSASIRTDDAPLANDDRPLRPSASVGLHLSVPFRPRAFVDLAVGISPEGVSAAQVSFTRNLQSLRRPHHTADPVR